MHSLALSRVRPLPGSLLRFEWDDLRAAWEYLFDAGMDGEGVVWVFGLLDEFGGHVTELQTSWIRLDSFGWWECRSFAIPCAAAALVRVVCALCDKCEDCS